MIGDNTTSKKWTPSGSLQFVSVLQYYLLEHIHSTPPPPPPPNINVCASDVIHIKHMYKHAWKVLHITSTCQASVYIVFRNASIEFLFTLLPYYQLQVHYYEAKKLALLTVSCSYIVRTRMATVHTRLGKSKGVTMVLIIILLSIVQNLSKRLAYNQISTTRFCS